MTQLGASSVSSILSNEMLELPSSCFVDLQEWQ